MLLDDLDRTIEIDSAVEADDVEGLPLRRHTPTAETKTSADIKADAVDVLPADAPAELVQAAERLVAAGYRIVRAEAYNREVGADNSNDTPHLSPRELEVLALLAEGAPNKVIARRMDISVHTAKFHVASILQKLGAANRTDAMATAIRQGLLAV